LHGDLKADNFKIQYSPKKQYEIKLPFRNGQTIHYKSNYRVVFIDFGISHLKYTFHNKSKNEQVEVNMYPFEDDLWEYSIPLVDVTKLLTDVFAIVSDNKHSNLSSVNGYITNFLKLMFETIGKPKKRINLKYINKINSDDCGYIKELIDANLTFSFEELYLMLVSNTDEHLKVIENKHLEKDPKNRFNIHYEHIIGSKISKEDTEIVKELRAISKIKEDKGISKNIEGINETLRNIVGSTSQSNVKIEQIHSLFQQSINKNIAEDLVLQLTDDQLEFMYINTYYNFCHFEINRGDFEQENEMVQIVDRVYKKFAWFRDNTKSELGEIPPKVFEPLDSKKKYKVLEKLLEFKIDVSIDKYIKKTNVTNIAQRYQELLQIVEEDTIKTVDANEMHSIIKSLVVRNLSRMPLKFLQHNIVQTQLIVNFVNPLDKVKYIAENVRDLHNQMKISDIPVFNADQLVTLGKINKSDTHSATSQKFYIKKFFSEMYKHCETESESVISTISDQFVDWISYNRIILYDFFIRYLHAFDISTDFVDLFFLFLEMENEIWEKFYKEEHFWSMANSISLGKAMLTLLMNPKLETMLPTLQNSIQNTQFLEQLNKINVDNIKVDPSLYTTIMTTFEQKYHNF
jgi:hypothetical protein